MGLSSFDQLSAFRECPEFLAHVSMNYPVYGGRGLTTQLFPGFLALESAISFCLAGCVGCLLSPETNLHGSLRARESVNKVLLDAFFSDRIVGAAARGNAVARVCYPGTGIGCTCDWADNTRVIDERIGPGRPSDNLHPAPSHPSRRGRGSYRASGIPGYQRRECLDAAPGLFTGHGDPAASPCADAVLIAGHAKRYCDGTADFVVDLLVLAVEDAQMGGGSPRTVAVVSPWLTDVELTL